MSKYPYRYRTLGWFWIQLYMFLVWLVATVAVTAFIPSAIFFVFFAVAGGWQMGVLSERNEWMEWYKSEQSAKKQPTRPQGETDD